MNHQPFEEWLLNEAALTPAEQHDLDSHLRGCVYCAMLVKTEKVLRAPRMVIPAAGFAERFQTRLIAQKAAEARRRRIGSFLFTAGGIVLLGVLTAPYLVSFWSSPGTWLTLAVDWIVFFLSALDAIAQAGSTMFGVLFSSMPVFVWMMFLSFVAGTSLLWSVSIWRFVRVPQGV